MDRRGEPPHGWRGKELPESGPRPGAERRDQTATAVPNDWPKLKDNPFARNPESSQREIVRSLGVKVQAVFARAAPASTVASILHRQNIRRHPEEEAVGVGPSGDIGSVSVKSQERKLRIRIRSRHQRRQPHPVRGGNPLFFNRQATRVPVSIQPAGHVGKKNETFLEYARKSGWPHRL